VAVARRIESLPTRLAWTAYAVFQTPRQRGIPFRSPAAIERMQRRRLRGAVAHAYEHVPYYQETMRRLGLTPADIVTGADLARLPIIERAELQRDPEYFISQARPLEEYVKLATDGTSGQPVVIYHDPFALFQGIGHSERRDAAVFKLTGKRFRLRRARLGSTSGTTAKTSEAVRSRILVPARIRYTDKRFSMFEDPAVNAGLIDAFRPDFMGGYGSVIEAIYVHAHESGMTFHAPKAVAYGADSVSEPIRRLMMDKYGTTPLSHYGSGEVHHIGLECEEHNGLHVNADLYPLRIVDAAGRELPDGESGEVVVSNLVNRATVLLNYRLGDRATKRTEPCTCGRSLPLMSLPEGRTDDWVESESGERVHAQGVRMLLLAEDPLILAFQVVQEERARFTVSAVTLGGTDHDALASRIRRRFAERLGDGVTTEVRFVSELERTPGGKVRVVSRRREPAQPASPPPAP
jgi:phenylacetate-CoA ligase